MVKSERTGLKSVFPLASLALLTVLICMTKYADYDLWWHLKLGETVFSTHSLPWLDTFSYTAAGRHQFTGEWLADLIIFLTFQTAGFLGLNLLKALLLLLSFSFLFLQMKSASKGARGAAFAAVISLVVVLFAVRFRLFVRPYLFSLPFMALFLYLLGRWRSNLRDRYIYLLPAFMLLWANMSVGAVFGLFLLGVGMLLDIVENKSWRLMPVLLLSIVASLLNPESWRLYSLALDLTSDPYRALVGEYQPITKDILFGSGLRYTLCFQLLALGGAGMGIGNLMQQATSGAMQQGQSAGSAAKSAGIPDVMTPAEAAGILRVSEEDVLAAIQSGDLKAKKLGRAFRISKEALEAFLKG